MRCFMVFGLLLSATPALAQSGGGGNADIMPVRPPNQRPADAQNADGRATAKADVLSVIAASKQRPARVLLGPDAANIRDLLLYDGKLDEPEIDLLDELTASAIRAITISPASGGGEPVVTGTVSGDTLRIFETVFDQRYRTMWDAPDAVAGWTALLREARRSDASHSRVRKFLAGMTTQAARDSTAANIYEPARKWVSAYASRNEKLPMPERTLGRRLAYEAFVDGDFNVGGRLPDFIYSWLKQPPKP